MNISKEDFAKKIEALVGKSQILSKELVKDLSDIIVFLSIYGGKNGINVEPVELQINKLALPKIIQLKDKFNSKGELKEIKEVPTTQAQKYILSSYDGTQTMKVILSKPYLKIERIYDDKNKYFVVDYVSDKNGNYTRRVEQRSCLLGRQFLLKETSEGKMGTGIYFSEITEKNEEMKTICFKVPNNNNGEDLFYSYKAKPEFDFLFKASSKFTKIPVVNSAGMGDLNEMLSQQFEDDFIKIENKEFFNKLLIASQKHYREEKK